MRTRFALASLMLAVVATAAEPPRVETIVERTRELLEPPQASTRKMTLTVSGEGGETRFTIVQARKIVDGQPRMLTVVLAPAEQRGVASLIMRGKDGAPDVRALWVPAVRRTRMLTPVGGHEAFMNSDFTYADLGFVDTAATFTLLGTTTRNGKQAYEIQRVPKAEWYYSKVVSLVDQATLLPLERRYYDPAGALWKVETFEDVTVIDGHPVATHIAMVDQQSKQSSALVVDALKFGVDLPDPLFEPKNLRTAVDSPVWPSVL